MPNGNFILFSSLAEAQEAVQVMKRNTYRTVQSNFSAGGCWLNSQVDIVLQLLTTRH